MYLHTGYYTVTGQTLGCITTGGFFLQLNPGLYLNRVDDESFTKYVKYYDQNPFDQGKITKIFTKRGNFYLKFIVRGNISIKISAKAPKCIVVLEKGHGHHVQSMSSGGLGVYEYTYQQ